MISTTWGSTFSEEFIRSFIILHANIWNDAVKVIYITRTFMINYYVGCHHEVNEIIMIVSNQGYDAKIEQYLYYF